MVIPYTEINPDILQNIIEEFVSRNGTDNGYLKMTLEQNVTSVQNQLKHGRVFIVYDYNTQTCNIVPKEDLNVAGSDE